MFALLQEALVYVANSHTIPCSYDRTGRADSFIEYQIQPGDISKPIPPALDFLATVVLPDGTKLTSVPTFTKTESCDRAIQYHSWSVFHTLAPAIPMEMLGMHVWETCRSDGIIEVAIEFSNATVWDTGNKFITTGGLFYDQVVIGFATRAPIYTDLRKGETQNGRLFTLIGSGTHYFPSRGQFTRRFVISAERNTANAQKVYEKTNLVLPAQLHSYGTLKGTYASYTPAADSYFDGLKAFTHTGVVKYPFTYPPQGCFFGIGGAEPGDVGGDGIVPILPDNPSQLLARRLRLESDLRQERNRIAAYKRVDGQPMRPIDWARGTDSQGFEYVLTRSGYGIGEIPLFLNTPDYNSSTNTLALQEKATLVYVKPDDEQHLCRYNKLNQGAAFLMNDAPAKFRLNVEAAEEETSWSLLGPGPFVKAYEGQWLPFSLKQSLLQANANPHHGSQVMRSIGWALDSSAAYLASCGTNMTRSAHMTWANAMLNLVEISVLPSGIGIDGHYPYADNGVPWTSYGVPMNCGEFPMFQTPIWCNGIFGCAQLLPENHTSLLQATVVKATDEIFWNLPKVPSIWGGNAVGPPYYNVVSTDNVMSQHLSQGYGLSHWIHCWHQLALAYRVTGNQKYLDMFAQIGSPGPKEKVKNVTDKTWVLEPVSVLN